MNKIFFLSLIMCSLLAASCSKQLNQILGLGLALLLFGSGIWANVSGGSLSQEKGAWVSHASR